MLSNFQDKVAVITGGASGIGLAVAQNCAAAGMKLVLADIEEANLDRVTVDFERDGVEVLPLVIDVSNYDAVEAMARQTIERFGKVHFLFNNAGVSGGSSVWETTLNDWDWVMGVNVMGVVYGIKAFTPIMLEQGEEGHIVNTASIAGLIAGPSMGAYRVSKHAVVALTETLYLELEQIGAKVGASVLCPAWVKTQIFTSDRNRPSGLQNDGSNDPTDPKVQAQLAEAGRSVQEDGIPPSVVADHVMDAVQNNRFYILTHPNFNGAVAYRMKDILEGNNPRNLFSI
ncbi:MAG: SDR family NAD(P)-dependent oxidoreductase [Ardenticatenaceae bacterium]|nr:SDR family NAD(P)-dependent oxidoreductase [Ardenticatenaceae bacterium]